MNEEIQGWINLYKPKNISSFFAIKKVKARFDLKKIGHGGTLDPAAEGILPIAIGKTTKLIPFINNNQKKYIFKIKWGQKTTTDDAEGEIINSCDYIPKEKQILIKLNNFIGNINQTPPLVSANKVDGKPAYKLFRENKKFQLKSKNVYVKNLTLLKSNSVNYSNFEIECGRGFYVRSFARDLAESLGTFGHITYLKRTKVGLFLLKNSILLDDLLKIRQTLPEFNCFHSSVSMLDDILAYEVEREEELINLSLGKSININLNKLIKPRLNSFDENLLFLSKNGNIISYGKLNGNLFQPKRILI